MTTKKMPYYKILNEKENHYGLQYYDGLNEDSIPFHPKGSCLPGGMYYSREDILAFLPYGPWLREVKIVKALLKAGANIHVGNDRALKWSSYYGYLEVVKALLEAGADVKNRNQI